jgi:hypothetical protein
MYPRDPGSKELGGTSELTAEAISGHARTVRARALAFLTARYPRSFTADEIAAALGESILIARPRVSELRRIGLIEPNGERRLNKSGVLAKCWRPVITAEPAVEVRAGPPSCWWCRTP